MKERNAFQAHNSAIRSACFSGDGSMIAHTSEHKAVELWIARTGQDITRVSTVTQCETTIRPSTRAMNERFWRQAADIA
jgi:WD40 repeat protein